MSCKDKLQGVEDTNRLKYFLLSMLSGPPCQATFSAPGRKSKKVVGPFGIWVAYLEMDIFLKPLVFRNTVKSRL